MAEPITESFVAHWRPTLRYHRHGLDVLDGLESSGLLRQFRVTDDEIGARTDDAELTISPGGATIRSRLPVLSNEVLHLLRLVFAAAAPPNFEYSLLYQYLIPITDKSYDETRRLALARMSHNFFDGLGVVDFAMLLDGSQSGSDWNCEFGIVSQEEIDSRLRREVGRVRYYGGAPWVSGDVSTDIPVAFFADMVWRVHPQTTPDLEGLVDGLVPQIQTLRDQSDGIVTSIYTSACDRSLQTSGGRAEP